MRCVALKGVLLETDSLLVLLAATAPQLLVAVSDRVLQLLVAASQRLLPAVNAPATLAELIQVLSCNLATSTKLRGTHTSGSQQEAETDTRVLGRLRSWRRPVSDRMSITWTCQRLECLQRHLLMNNCTAVGAYSSTWISRATEPAGTKDKGHTGTRASATKRLMKASAVPSAVCNGVVAAGDGADG